MTPEQLLEKYGWYLERRIQAEIFGSLLAVVVLTAAAVWFIIQVIKILLKK